jgi:phosphoketolase
MERFGSSALPAKAERQTRGERNKQMTPGTVPLTTRGEALEANFLRFRDASRQQSHPLEKGTTTPFDMAVVNRMSRYDLAIEALRRAPQLLAQGGDAIKGFEEKLRAHQTVHREP